MKYYKNPIPRKEIELINPCPNCERGFGSSSTGTDELGDYVEFTSCKDDCEIRKNYLNSFGENIYSEFIDENQMRKLNVKEDIHD